MSNKIIPYIERHTRHLKSYAQSIHESKCIDFAIAIYDDLERILMYLNGINPGGNIIDYQQINKNIEIGLIEHTQTLEMLWRYNNRETGIVLDYDKDKFEDIWKFKSFLLEKGLII